MDANVTARSGPLCYIHVGLPKTGTSFLQQTFWQSTDALHMQGMGMLPDRRRDHFLATLQLRDLLDPGMDRPHAFEALQRLSNQASTFSRPAALLSEEALAPAQPGQVKRLVELLDGFEVHVVVTTRSLARQIPSAWQQRMQHRQTYGFDEFVAAVVERRPLANDFWVNQDLVDVLSRWRTSVPPERIHVVTVPPAGGSPAALLLRFCEVVGIDPSALPAGDTVANASLGFAQAELLRRVNIALGDRLPHLRAGYGRVARDFLANQILAVQHGETPLMPRHLSGWCRHTAETWIGELTHGGYDVVGDLGDLRPLDSDFADVEQKPTEGDLVDAAASSLAMLLDLRLTEVRDLDRLRGEMKSQVASASARRRGGIGTALLAHLTIARRIRSRLRLGRPG